MLLEAFEDLVNANQCQVILTTHTPTLVRKVSGRRLRLITQSNGSSQILSGSHEPVLDAIKTTLGVLPDHDIRAFLGLEGRNDIEFMRRISRILHGSDASIPDLEAAEKKGQLVFIPLSGSSLDLWVERLAGLERPEFYLTDRDTVPPAEAMYQMHVDKWNQRANCTAWVTNKRTLENYLHPDAIKSLFPKYSGNGDSMEDVPCLLAEIVHASSESNYTWAEVLSDSDKLGKKLSNAKRRLNKECVEAMTLELLSQIDPKDELKSWLRSVGEAL